MDFLAGYKTYIAGAVLMVVGIVHYAITQDSQTSLQILANGLGFIGLRAAITPAK